LQKGACVPNKKTEDALHPAHQGCTAEAIAVLEEHDAEFQSPASSSEIAAAEQQLGVSFPAELRQLYLKSNGFLCDHGAHYLLSLEDLVKTNREMWDGSRWGGWYMPFSCLLFFGEEGNGDLFAFRILDGKVDQFVFEWDHECDDRVSRAFCLGTFYKRLLGDGFDD
jgi:hypothetical protein